MLQWETIFFFLPATIVLPFVVISFDNPFLLHLQPKFWDQSIKKTDCSGYDFHLMCTYINILFKHMQCNGAVDEWSECHGLSS